MSVSTAQVVTLLENVLFESQTLAQANAAAWEAKSQDIPGAGTVAGLASTMALSTEATITQQVVRYYEGALGRAPAGSEILYYVNIVETGLTSAQIAEGASAVPQSSWNIIASDFAHSPEFQTISSSTDVVSLLYLNILARQPGASEVAYYQAQIAQGYDSTTLIQEFTNSPEYQQNVASDIRLALTGYGSSVVSGTTPVTIPLTSTAHVTTANLGSDALTVTGGPVTQTVIVLGTPAATAQSAVTAVTGVVGVSGVTAATGVQGVTAIAAVTPIAGQSAVTAATDGAVTVTDYAFASGGAGTLTTVNLANSGAGSVINDNALATLDLTGTTGTLTINNNGAGNQTLTMTVNGLSAANNTVTDANGEVSTLDIAAITADSTLKGFVDASLTTINLSGTNKLTLLSFDSTLVGLNVTGGASFSDGASVHGTGLAALGANLTITDSSSGSFAAVLDDTTQSFTATGGGADIITVSALANATQTFTAGSSSANEIIFEGGAYALTSASSGKFVNFQILGVAANVSGTVDLSVIDPTAGGLEVMGANFITFTKAAAGAGLLLDPSAGASVAVNYADSTGATDSVKVTLSSAVTSLSLQDSTGAGIGTVSFVDTLASGETDVSAAHLIGTFIDNDLSTLNLSGNAGLTIAAINETGSPAASLTLNNGSTNFYGLTINTLSDSALATLNFGGNGATTIGSLTSGAATLAITNSSATIQQIGTLTDSALTSLALADNVALGQASSALTTNGLQDSASSGIAVAGASDNAHVTLDLTSGAVAGKTDAIALGNGNNVVVDASTAGTVTVTLGSGANLVELGSAALDTTATYSVTLATRTATPPNAIVIGAAGTSYASAPNLVISGATTGDIIAFGNDTASSATALTATSLTGASSVAGAIAALEALAASAHKVVYGIYGGNTYIVETVSGTVGGADTTVVEVTGTQTLTASTGYVTLGGTASTLTAGGLTGGGFTIPAGTPTTLTLKSGADVVTLTGPSTGITDTFTSLAASTGLTINYTATSGTDTIQMAGSGGSSRSDIASLIVNDTSTGSAGVTIGGFTDNSLTSATYNDSAVGGAIVTQSALVSSSLATINLTGGIAGTATNTYFISATLTTQSAVTVNDSNLGSGSTTMGLTLNGGTSSLTLNMTGPGTLATGALTDNNLAALSITGSGTGNVNVGALSDSLAGTFTVTDSSTSTGSAVIVLTGLSAATSLTVNDSAAGSLTDSSAYTDSSLASLTLKNTGSAALTIGGGGIQANALASLTITGSGTGSIATGTLSDTGSAAFTVTDSYASTGSVTLPLGGVSAATSITIADTGAGTLSVGAITDNALTALTVTGSGTVVVGAISDTLAGAVTFTDNSTTTTAATWTIASLPNATAVTFDDGAKGAWTIGSFTDSSAATLTFNNTGSAQLTASGITDSAAAVTLAIAGSGTGTEAIALTDAGATSLTITDTSTSTGAATVTPALTGGPAAITVTDSAAGALTVEPVSDANLTSLTLTNTGSAPLTLGYAAFSNFPASGISGTAVLSALTFAGSGPITTWVTATDSTGTLTLTDSDSGTVTVNTLNLGTTATDTNTLVVANSDTGSGSLTIAGGTTYLTSLTLSNAGTGSDNVTLSDAASGAVTVTVSGTGSETLNFTDTAATVTLTQTGSANLILTLTAGSVAGDQITLGGGIDAVTLSSGHTAGIAMAFTATLGSNADISPVTADVITHFLTDSGTVRGDTLQLGALGSSVTTLLTTADANTNGNTLWTVSAGGMMTKQGASVLNFIGDVQSVTQAGGVATTSGVAGFSDGTNTWIAYNDHAGHVAVIELAGVVAAGIETGASLTAGYVHIV